MKTATETQSVVPDYDIALLHGKFSKKKRDINPAIMKRVFHECDYKCVVCGLQTMSELPRDVYGRIMGWKRHNKKLVPSSHHLTIDHIVPKFLGSANHYLNLLVLCSDCNNRKANKLPREWLKTLKPEIQDLLLERIIRAEVYHVLVAEPTLREEEEMKVFGKYLNPQDNPWQLRLGDCSLY